MDLVRRCRYCANLLLAAGSQAAQPGAADRDREVKARVARAVNRALWGQDENRGGRGRTLDGVLRTFDLPRGPVPLFNPEQLRQATWWFLRHLAGDLEPGAEDPIESLGDLAHHLGCTESEVPERLARALKDAPRCARSKGWDPSVWAVCRVADAALGNLNRAGKPTGAFRKVLERATGTPEVDPERPATSTAIALGLEFDAAVASLWLRAVVACGLRSAVRNGEPLGLWARAMQLRANVNAALKALTQSDERRGGYVESEPSWRRQELFSERRLQLLAEVNLVELDRRMSAQR